MSITMFDAVTWQNIPKDAEAVAGYVNGRWPTYNSVVKAHPKAHHLSIAVSSNADADCLDVEPGDATNFVAPAWVERQLARGVKRPCVYTSVSNAKALLAELARHGIMRSQIRLWTAHYTFRPHRCNAACGFGMPTLADATQWTDKALGRSLDQSLCADDFFGAKPVPPKPTPPPVPVPPKPTPPPAPSVARFIRIEDKDHTVTYVPYSKAARLRRGMQFARGKFKGLRVVTQKDE